MRFSVPTLAVLVSLGGPAVWATAATPTPTPKATPVSVLTQRYDNLRSGLNLHERVLNTATVNANSFGLLFTRPVDGELYAQPLYVPHLAMPGKGTRNVVFVATEHNSVYAFDADDPEAAAPLWQANFGPSIPRTEVGQACGTYLDFVNEIGITGTPVIDAERQTIYFVARTKNADGTYHQHLHALALTTGQERPGSPVEITATYPGTGDGNQNGVLSFEPHIHNQRAALLLLDGVVYVTWASHCDTGPYHGWLLGYDAASLEQVTVYNTTPNGWAGGVWQSGTGISADADGFLYLITGNGTFTVDKGGSDYGDTFVKLKVDKQPDGTRKLVPVDWFTPSDQAELLRDDADLGSTGALLVPQERLLLGANKRGNLYLVSMDKFGGYHPEGNQNVETFMAANGGSHFHGTPVYWRGPNGPLVYVWGENDFLKMFKLSGGKLEQTPAAQSKEPAPGGMPGGFVAVSADGDEKGNSKPGTGILWASRPLAQDANHANVPGILHAFDATDVSKELWNSRQQPERDDLGIFAKFCTPTVANGKVYLATFSNQLAVYGLNPPPLAGAPAITPNGGDPSAKITLTAPLAGAQIRYTTDGSKPTALAPLYQGPFTLDHCARVQARTFKKGFAPSAVTGAFFSTPAANGTGQGLAALYFSLKDLSGVAVERTDAKVDFGWPNNSPAPGIGPDNWSARWTGQVQPRYTDTYTFYVTGDDGVRLWVNGQLIIDQWHDQAATESSGTIALQAGQKYALKLEYFQSGGGAECRLAWSSVCQEKEIIPPSQLYAAGG